MRQQLNEEIKHVQTAEGDKIFEVRIFFYDAPLCLF